MKLIWLTLLWILTLGSPLSPWAPPGGVNAAGAGRAFPIDSENFAIESFRKIKPTLIWDPSNFLTDLSGQYANCKLLHEQGTQLVADRRTPEGASVVLVFDSIEGSGSDVNAVNGYIQEVIKRWVASRQYHAQVVRSDKVGCSVRPGCSVHAIVVCAFSSADKGGGGTPSTPPWPTNPPTTWWRRTTRQDFTSPWRPDFSTLGYRTTSNGFQPDNTPPAYEKPKALAFTPQQYELAEEIMRKKWDRAHFLENLSGFETDCGMVGAVGWTFDFAQKICRERDMKVTGLYGSAPNRGSTPDALKQILTAFKPAPRAKSIGCSVIPDCPLSSGGLQVVVSCLYEEQP
jgi:hypothetical protein